VENEHSAHVSDGRYTIGRRRVTEEERLSKIGLIVVVVAFLILAFVGYLMTR
jgi:hypothetical protein